MLDQDNNLYLISFDHFWELKAESSRSSSDNGALFGLGVLFSTVAENQTAKP